MLRFIPDTWIEGLLRPLLLLDPTAGLYSEMQAPDGRFALVALMGTLALLTVRSIRALTGPQWRTLVALALGFYAWTFASGNGRYFLWGLLVVGPLAVAAIRSLPATPMMRNTLIVSALALQGWVVWMNFEPNGWALRPWTRGPGLGLEDTPLKQQPAVFVTIGSISHSILVPQMHPQSRWTNVAGQQDLVPGLMEYARFQALLDSPLPHYAVVRATRKVMTEGGQPITQAWDIINRTLARYGLKALDKPCTFVKADIADLPFEVRGKLDLEHGFWFCEITRSGQAANSPEESAMAPELDPVFAQVEARCPRFFPPGNARTRPADEAVVRHYSESDTSLYINTMGAVFYKHMRSINPTEIGMKADVLAGKFKLECTRLPGRYTPPWSRD